MRGYINVIVYVFIIILFMVMALYMFYNNISIKIMDVEVYVDTLSLPFILNAGVIGSASIISSYRYIDIYREKNIRMPYYSLLKIFILTMMLIPMVRNWIAFIFLWEIMTLVSYFLIIYDYRDERILRIGRNYLITMHVLSTTPLLLLFMMIRHATSTYNFSRLHDDINSVMLLLALIGFGTKAGLFPFHFWLPQAHPVAPSPVSALLSGSMVKMGVYGMARVIALSSMGIPEWFIWIIMVLALLSMLTAFLMYPIQRDVKRLFAWSTIDNIGWLTMTTSLIALGLNEAEIILGVYVLSHGIAKATVFILSGGILYSYGTRELDGIKGLIHSNKSFAYMLILAIFALEGIPPFSMFMSRHDIVLKTIAINMWLAIVLLAQWCLTFIIFLSIIHNYLLSEGVPRQIRRIPRTIIYPSLFLTITSIVAYPIALIVMRGVVW